MLNRKRNNEQWIDETKNTLLTNTMSLDDNSHNSADSWVNSKYKRWSNFNWIAYMIYDYSIAEWAKNVPSNPRDIMDQYALAHPENQETISNAIMNEDLDLEQFWIEQWWIPSEEDEQMDWVIGWWRGVLDTFLSFTPQLTTSVRNWVDSWETILAELQWDEEKAQRAKDFWVLENLAFAKYWKNVNELSDREIAKLQEMAKDEKVMKDYEATWNKGIATWLWGVLDLLFTASMPWAKAKLSIAANTPVLNIPIEVLWLSIQGLWRIANLVPWLSNFRDSLWGDEFKKMWDAAAWSALFLKAASNKKVQKWTTKKLQSLANRLWLSEVMKIYNEYKTRFENATYDFAEKAWEKLWEMWYWWPKEEVVEETTEEYNPNSPWKNTTKEDIYEVWKWVGKRINDNFFTPAKERTYNQADWNRRLDEVTTPEEIENTKYKQNELSTKITWWKGTSNRQREAVTNALNLLDRDVKSNIYDYEQLVNALIEKEQKPFIEYENQLLSKFSNKLTPEQIEELTSKEMQFPNSEGGVPYWRDPVKRARDVYRRMRKYNMENGKAPTEKDAAFEAMLDKYEKEWATYLDLYNLARYLSREFNIWKKNGSWEAKDSISADLINELRTELKSIARKEIVKQYPELAWVLETLDKYWSDATVSIELLSDMIEAARWERWKVPLRNEAQEQASSYFNKFKNWKDYWANLLLWWKKYTPETMNSEMNYILKVQDEYFDQLWRKGYQLDDIIDKINNLVTEEYNSNPELFNNKEYLNLYKKHLTNLLEWLGYKPETVAPRIDPLFENIQESLFDVQRESVLSDADLERLNNQVNIIDELSNLKKAVEKPLKKSKNNNKNKPWLFDEE